MACFLLITPLAAISGWLCLRGAQDHLQLKSRLEAVGLIALTIALFTIYILWTLVTNAKLQLFSNHLKVAHSTYLCTSSHWYRVNVFSFTPTCLGVLYRFSETNVILRRQSHYAANPTDCCFFVCCRILSYTDIYWCLHKNLHLHA